VKGKRKKEVECEIVGVLLIVKVTFGSNYSIRCVPVAPLIAA